MPPTNPLLKPRPSRPIGQGRKPPAVLKAVEPAKFHKGEKTQESTSAKPQQQPSDSQESNEPYESEPVVSSRRRGGLARTLSKANPPKPHVFATSTTAAATRSRNNANSKNNINPSNVITIIDEDSQEDNKTYTADPAFAGQVQIKDQDPDETMAKFLIRHCRIFGRDSKKTKLLFNGKGVRPGDTLNSLGMKNGDVLEIADIEEEDEENSSDTAEVKVTGRKSLNEDTTEVIRKDKNLPDARAKRAARRNRMRGQSEDIVRVAEVEKKNPLRGGNVAAAKGVGGSQSRQVNVQPAKALAVKEKSKSIMSSDKGQTEHQDDSQSTGEHTSTEETINLTARTTTRLDAPAIQHENKPEYARGSPILETQVPVSADCDAHLNMPSIMGTQNTSSKAEDEWAPTQDSKQEDADDDLIQSVETVAMSSQVIPETPLNSTGNTIEAHISTTVIKKTTTKDSAKSGTSKPGEGGLVTVKVLDKEQNTVFEGKVALSGLNEGEQNDQIGYVCIDYKGSRKRYKLF